jgi:hypothetical protein
MPTTEGRATASTLTGMHLHQASIRWASMLQLGGCMMLLKQATVSVALLVLMHAILVHSCMPNLQLSHI